MPSTIPQEVPFELRAFDVPATAAALDVSVRTVVRMIRSGQLQSIKLRGRRVVPGRAIRKVLEGAAA
jgi:excisionase family DNA binding protein